MGANSFYTISKAETPTMAFNLAVHEAKHESGCCGYTGTIAEKTSFKSVSVPTGVDPRAFADSCMEDDNHFCQDKWGPAACVQIEPGTFMFFGYASC